MIKDPNYKCISSQEASNGVGVKILVTIPEGDLTEDEINEVQHVGYKLYEDLQGRLYRRDPKEAEGKKAERNFLLACFGERPIFVEEIPSGYDKQYGRPWFVVTTCIGRVKIGWRKKVINIDWSDTVVKTKAEDLFKDENVTKGSYDNYFYVHAWSYEKAKEYIDKIHAEVKKE